jgi:hypothetical protein
MLGSKTSFSTEFKKPVNVVIFFITVISFLIALIIFFNVVLADFPMKTILSKVDIISLFAQQSPDLKNALNTGIDNYEKQQDQMSQQNGYKNYADEIQQQVNDRNSHNLKALFSFGIVPYLLCFVVMFLIYGIVIFVKSRKDRSFSISFEKGDNILIIFALLSFIVEIILYFVLIQNWKFIPDNEIYQTLLIQHQ